MSTINVKDVLQRITVTDQYDPSTVFDKIDIAAGLQEHKNEIAPDKHKQIVERVTQFYIAMKRDQEAVDAPYRPSGEWLEYVNERSNFYQGMLKQNLAVVEETLSSFWRNELSPIVKEYAKYEDLLNQREEFIDRFTFYVLRNYLIWRDLYQKQADVLDIPRVGNPWGVWIDNVLVAPKACRFHTLSRKISDLASDIESPLVAEIGGGYCGMAYYLLRDHANVSYCDFDLPETIVIAAYYLLACVGDEDVYLYGESDSASMSQAIKNKRIVLLPNYCIPALEENFVDVWVNSFSLSEIGPMALEEYLKQITRTIKNYFLHNNMDRKGVVNRGYERIPCSSYPIDRDQLKLICKTYDLFHGHFGDYKEYLYQKKQ